MGNLRMNKSGQQSTDEIIRIARDFSPYPAGRYRKDGPFSGQAFREDTVLPRLKKTDRITIDIDGVAGLPSSFWEEVFGGLVRREGLTPEFVRQHVRVYTSEKSLEPFVRMAYKFAEEAAH
jgi:hypothetical protein